MKNLDLNKSGVLEMNAKEMQTTEGGILALLVMLGGFLIGATIAHFTAN